MNTLTLVMTITRWVIGTAIAVLILYGTYLVIFDPGKIGAKAGEYRKAFDSVYYNKR